MNKDEMHQKVKQYLQMLRFLNESTDDYLFVWDFKTGSIYFAKDINERFPIGLQPEQGYQVEDWEKIVYFKDLSNVKEDFVRLIRGETDTHDMEYRLVDRRGRRIWINCRGKSIFEKDNSPLMMIGRVSDQSLKRADSLSGIWSGGRFEKDLKAVVSEKLCGYLMAVCVDNLKNINIIYGRDHGDQMLLELMNALEDMVETPDSVYWLSGNRFAVNLIGKNKESVETLYETLKERMSPFCTFSAGAVFYTPENYSDAAAIYQYAEIAMDRAKKQGSILEFFSIQDYEEWFSYLELQDEMRHAIENGFEGFSLFYQPQIDSNSYEMIGAEALLRYESARQGKILPAQFIPLLEETGMICQVGYWVLETALKKCVEWRKKIKNFHISVNISYIQLKQENIGDLVLQCLTASGLPGEALTLELTESIQLEEYPHFNRIFYQWAKAGIQIALDDFGTGYANLSYLKSIDIHEIKIDRSLVSRLQYSTYNYQLLGNLIELAHSVQIRVCCEGIETEGELLALQDLKPDVLQGYLFAAPYSQEKFEELYIRNDSDAYQERRKEEEYYRYMGINADRKAEDHISEEDPGVIAENIEDIIYVSNPQSHELYYLNPAGRSMAGIYDYKGQPCYQVLYGRTSPCEFCNNKDLKTSNFLTAEITNRYHNRRFIAKDKLIPWKGKLARFEVAHDVTERMDINKNDKKFYKLLENRNEEILNKMELGLWIVRVDQERGRYELFADSIMLRILGIQENVTPEECYSHWHSRINDGYNQYVNKALEKMVSTRQIVQLEYTWIHPEHGEVMVRSIGVRMEDRDGEICLQGYHRIISDINRTSFLPVGITSERFEYNEQKQAIYFHTDRNLLSGAEEREEQFPECWIRKGIVHPHFADEFRKIFLELNVEESIGKELLLKAKSGSYKWFRMKIQHLSQNDGDDHIMVVILELVEEERSVELELARISDFYNAMLSETVAYAEVDVESGQLMKADGLWADYETESYSSGTLSNDLVREALKKVVRPEDEGRYWKYLNVETMKQMYARGEVTRKWCFKRKINGEFHWVKLVVHVFKEKFMDNMYALLYLKDIDIEKRQQLETEEEASRDPLTNVYNRRALEREIVRYMIKTPDAKGALIVLDLDNFKHINDEYGHLEGDAALKHLTEALMTTFRRKDLVGRLGGDEFLVFISNINETSILERRMRELFCKLRRYTKIQLSCSAGITFVNAQNFSYETSLQEADQALYLSKQSGKNMFRYYDRDLQISADKQTGSSI